MPGSVTGIYPAEPDGQAGGTLPAAGRTRVAVIITRLEGGAGQLALLGAQAIHPAAFEVTIITGSGQDMIKDAAASGLEVVIEPSLRRAVDPFHDAGAWRALASLLRRRDFEVVHTHTAKAGALGRLAAHHERVPRIVHTYHGFPFHDFQPWPVRAAYLATERCLGRITDLALCVGTGVAWDAVRRRLIAPERVRTIGVVAEGIPGRAGAPGPGRDQRLPAHDRAARASARRALGLPPDATVIGAVGRLTYQKAPEDFLAALRELSLPGVVGVWIGSGELAGRVAALAARQPHAPVILAGHRTDVPALMPAFDVFALTSRFEGLPTVVVEAMLCGVPVVATAVNAVGDVVVPGETGLLVPPQSPALLAAALRHMLGSPQAAASMARAAHLRVRGRYTMAALGDALTQAYTADIVRAHSPEVRE